MDLQINDIVLIKCRDLEYVERVEKCHDGYFETRSFAIQLDGIVEPCFGSVECYSLEKIWRLDEHDDYIRIYPEREETKEDVEENEKPCPTAGDSWDRHSKVLQENTELKEIIINLNKEINKLKKGA